MAHGDDQGLKALSAGIEGRVKDALDRMERTADAVPQKPALTLLPGNGVTPGPLHPTPIFHARRVPMNAGFVRLSDIRLWDKNERLDIHLNQFRQKQGRQPTQEDLIAILTDKLKLPGMPTEEQFKVSALARSIAANGVQKAPIVSYAGVLLDGNRRVAACHYILHSDEFTVEEKRQADPIYVWQLTEHATETDEDAVVVALNFEDDCKQPWPQYIRARKIYEEWTSILALEPGASARRQQELKRGLSKRFALGNDLSTVNRYLKMMKWSEDFEDHLINERQHDAYEVKHRANQYFEYFDEVSKGERPGGVAHTLGQDDNLKHVVFDLLFQGKFRNWNLIRKLKYFDEEVRKGLLDALAMSTPDDTALEAAQDKVEAILDDAHARNAESRQIGANSRIEAFVRFIEDLPVKAFRDDVRVENLQALLRALKLISSYAKDILGEDGAST